MYSVSQKNYPPPTTCVNFYQTAGQFLIEILHTYYAFKYTIDCQILSNYLQIVQSYAALSATTPRILSLSLLQNINFFITYLLPDLNPFYYHVWGAMLQAFHKIHPKPKPIP